MPGEPESGSMPIEIYQSSTGDVQVRIDAERQTGWVTQTEMVNLFEVDRSVVSRHIKTIFESGELDEKSNLQKMQIANSDRPINLYSIDVVISVGYKTNSIKATQFRQWVSGVLKGYIERGFVLNENRLRDDPEAQKALARQLRTIRLSEQSQYEKVREVFKFASSDYQSGSRAAKSFFAIAQDKFHYAVSQRVAAQILFERADASKPNLGMKNGFTDRIHIDDAKIAKNYYDEDELQRMENLCDQFLLFAESKTFRGQKMTMEELSHKLNALLEFNGYPVLYDYPNVNRKQADLYVSAELKKYQALHAPEKPKQVKPKN